VHTRGFATGQWRAAQSALSAQGWPTAPEVHVAVPAWQCPETHSVSVSQLEPIAPSVQAPAPQVRPTQSASPAQGEPSEPSRHTAATQIVDSQSAPSAQPAPALPAEQRAR
jgi:hypothetical protein